MPIHRLPQLRRFLQLSYCAPDAFMILLATDTPFITLIFFHFIAYATYILINISPQPLPLSFLFLLLLPPSRRCFRSCRIFFRQPPPPPFLRSFWISCRRRQRFAAPLIRPVGR
jgi:hypothetical protein